MDQVASLQVWFVLAALIPFRIGLLCHLTHGQRQVLTGLCWRVSRRGREGKVHDGMPGRQGTARKVISHVFMGFDSQIKQSAKEMEVWNLQRVIKMFSLIPAQAVIKPGASHIWNIYGSWEVKGPVFLLSVHCSEGFEVRQIGVWVLALLVLNCTVLDMPLWENVIYF